MMIEKVMIQLGKKKRKKSSGGWGGGSPPYMIGKLGGAKNLKSSCRTMIEKVMIQFGVCVNRTGVAREELAILRMQEAKAKNQLGKQSSQSQKAAKSHKAKSYLPQRNWQRRGCDKRGTVNAEDAN